MNNIELGSRDFESPESLTKKELHLLQQEILNSQITSLWKKIKENTDFQNKFVEEKNTYLTRSKNEISKKWVNWLFDAVLKKYGIDEPSTSTTNPQESEENNEWKTGTTITKTESTELATENTPNENKLETSTETTTMLSSMLEELSTKLDSIIDEKIDFLEPISAGELYHSYFRIMNQYSWKILEIIQSKKEIIKQGMLINWTSESDFDKLWSDFWETIQRLINSLPEILKIMEQEKGQWPIITQENYNEKENTNKVLEYLWNLIEKIRKNPDFQNSFFGESNERKQETEEWEEKEITNSGKGNANNTGLEKQLLKIIYKSSLWGHLLEKESFHMAVQMAKQDKSITSK